MGDSPQHLSWVPLGLLLVINVTWFFFTPLLSVEGVGYACCSSFLSPPNSDSMASCPANSSISLEIVMLSTGFWDTCGHSKTQTCFSGQVWWLGEMCSSPWRTTVLGRSYLPGTVQQTRNPCPAANWDRGCPNPKGATQLPLLCLSSQVWLELRTEILCSWEELDVLYYQIINAIISFSWSPRATVYTCVITSYQSCRSIPEQMGPACVHPPLCCIPGLVPAGSLSLQPTLCSSFPHCTNPPPQTSMMWSEFTETTGQRIAGNWIIFVPWSGVAGPELAWIFSEEEE